MRIIFAVALVALISIVFVPSALAAPDADVPSIEWSKTFENLQINAIIQTSDGGYAVAGKAWPIGFPRVTGATLIKTDSSGNVEWQKNFSNIVSLAQLSDSGFVLFCENGDVIKTDAEGNILSNFTLEVAGTQPSYVITVAQPGFAIGVREGIVASDGTYIVVGNSVDNGEAFAWLRRVDSLGNILWDKNYTGGFHVSAVVETVDRGYALAGNWKTDFWLARLDSNGNQQWSQTYPYGDILDQHFVYSMKATKDGGFILAGMGNWGGNAVPWLIKINAQGHEQWNLPYGQYPDDSFSDVMQTADEGYLVVRGAPPTVIRMDSSGGELWQIPLDEQEGWASYYPSSCLIRTKDGGYAVAGPTSANGFLAKISPEADLESPVVTISSPRSKTYEAGDIQLRFTVNEETSWLGYSLDGQPTVTISGNTTLAGLGVGAHSLTVYARDLTGLEGNSETIQFTIVARFPTELVLVGVAVAVAGSVSFLLYVKRKSLSDLRKKGFTSLLKRQNIARFTSNRIVWTLTIMGLCILLIFVQLFFPYFYYSSKPSGSNPAFEMGMTYVYEQDEVGRIFDEVSRIRALGFDLIAINVVCDPLNPSAYSNTLTEVFFGAIRELNMKVALKINNHDSVESVDYYLERWGKDLTYVQVLNEPEVASSWAMGALFTDDEIVSKFEQIYAVIEQHQLSAQRYTNFGPGFVIRTNLPVQFSEKLDFVGFDVFMDSILTVSPNLIQLLHKITNKEIVIAEYGMSTADDQAQSDYIIKGLNLFKSMGLRGVWLVYWNSVGNSYGIRGRLAEQTLGEWIAQNT